MSLFSRRERLNVEAPPPADPFTAHELVTLRKMVAAMQRRSERKARQNEESGIVNELPGADSDAMRAEDMRVMHGKFDRWLDLVFPLVDARNAENGLPPEEEDVFDADGDDEDREAWIARSRSEGELLAERLARARQAQGDGK